MMLNRIQADQQMRTHYESVWQTADAWEFESSPYEQQRFAHLLTKLEDRRYGRGLEIGCGSGSFTWRLSSLCDQLVAIDISPTAVTRTAERLTAESIANVRVIAANIMDYDWASEDPWDVIVLSETIYSLGWLYPLFELGQLAENLLAASRPGGRLLLANTYGAAKDWLLRPYLIDTYRDLFRNAGFRLEQENIFSGAKHDQHFEVLVSLFQKGVNSELELR
jgi:protein-L-isoaspartate O-methyltransferase